MTHFFQFNIEQIDAGQRLDDFFAARFGSLSRMRIANLIESGASFVNGAVGRAGYRIITGDAVELSFDDGTPTAMSPEPIPIEIIYEDEHLLVVVKPTGMLVHPTMNVKSGTLANALAYHLNKPKIERARMEDGGSTLETGGDYRASTLDPPSSILHPPTLRQQPVTRPGLVHRLDRATSGLMVIAKTPKALTTLSRHFRKRLVEKRYLAVVCGNIEEETGVISAPIGRDPDQQPRWRVIDTGKPAETRFNVLERLGRATLLELQPVTGRTNQLRIHCTHIGHPIIGDEMHENRESRMMNESSSEESIETKQSTIRLCLHASRLAFHHPAGGKWMDFSSPLPADIVETLESYRSR